MQVLFLDTYVQNIPYYDDFLWGITFLKDHNELSFWDKVKHLFGQHNQHRVLWLRIAIVSIVELKGYLDFRLLTLAGNLGFLGLSLLYLRVLSRIKIPLIYLLPIPFIVHDLSTYHNMIVSYGVPNMTVIFLAILCFYWTTNDKKDRLWWGLLVGILATFTNGSGVLTLPCAVIGLLFLRRSWKTIVVYGFVSLIVLVGYFYSYETDYSELTLTWQSVPYFVEFMASYFPFAANPLLQAIMVSCLFFAIFKTFKRFPLSPTHSFVFISTGFLMGSGLLATLFRLVHHIPIPDWYFIYSYAFIGLVYIWLHYTYSKPLLRFGFFVVFMALSLFSYLHDIKHVVVNSEYLNNKLQADAKNYMNHRNWAYIPLKAGLQEEKLWQDNFDKLYDSGLVKLPNYIVANKPNQFHELTDLRVGQSDYEYTLSFKGQANKFEETSLGFVMSEDSSQIYYTGMYHYFNSLGDILKLRKAFNSNGIAVLPKKYSGEGIPAGTYKCGIYLKNESGQEKWLLSNEEIVIENW